MVTHLYVVSLMLPMPMPIYDMLVLVGLSVSRGLFTGAMVLTLGLGPDQTSCWWAVCMRFLTCLHQLVQLVGIAPWADRQACQAGKDWGPGRGDCAL